MESETEVRRSWYMSRGRGGSGGGAVYGMGLVGALFYYFQGAHTFGGFALGFVKAIVWPGRLVYQALSHLHM